LILDYSVHIGNPSDIDPVRPAIERLGALTGAPSLVAADRGYWDSTIETNLAAFGVGTVVIPRTGKLALRGERWLAASDSACWDGSPLNAAAEE
jgi:hypothetical protein